MLHVIDAGMEFNTSILLSKDTGCLYNPYGEVQARCYSYRAFFYLDIPL